VTTVGTGTGESARLRRKLEFVVPVLFDAGRRLIEHPRIHELYPEYLIASHGVIRASVPLMRAALERARQNAASDPVAAGLASYLEAHADEELDHDEWLLGDLALLGCSPEAVLGRPPSPTVASLVGAQYYWIRHYHPVAVLGYILLLEGYPITGAEIEELRARTGYLPAAFRTLAEHGELDPAHGAELDALIDRLPLTVEQRDVVALNALSSVELMTRAVDEIVERATPPA
jgi:pyrroloquinoline quinone (PQQ) biosynthesis protein C